MSRLILLCSAALWMLLAQSCTTENEDTLKTTGTIAYRSDVNLDFNGFFFLHGDDGVDYYPVNLPDEFHTAGLRVRFEARMLDDRSPIAGWGGGPKVELLHIQKL